MAPPQLQRVACPRLDLGQVDGDVHLRGTEGRPGELDGAPDVALGLQGLAARGIEERLREYEGGGRGLHDIERDERRRFCRARALRLAMGLLPGRAPREQESLEVALERGHV